MSNEFETQLYAPFPKEVERQLDKGGTTLTYIPVSEVIVRLNEAFGILGWSYTIVKCERDILDPDFLVAHVRMTVVDTTRDGNGGQKIKRNKAGEIIDLGDEYKGAVSDALKKAAQSFGIGLYLARSVSAPAQAQQQTRYEGKTRITEPSNRPSEKQIWKYKNELKKIGKLPPLNMDSMDKFQISKAIEELLKSAAPALQEEPEEPF